MDKDQSNKNLITYFLTEVSFIKTCEFVDIFFSILNSS